MYRNYKKCMEVISLSLDLACKRSILFSTRIRFSSETQPIKDDTIDKMVEQNLLFAGDAGLSLIELQKQHGLICHIDKCPIIQIHDLRASIERLKKNDRIIEKIENREKRYILTEETKNELEELSQSAEKRINKIIKKLFEYTDEGYSKYKEPFIECLCQIFSELGHNYALLISDKIEKESFFNHPSIPLIVGKIKKKYKDINVNSLNEGIISFFEDNSPDANTIKWNMAQNYYVARAIGLDPSGKLLSSELFSNSTFYLDTNIIIDSLPTVAPYHYSFQSFIKSCQHLNISLNVCQITLDELKSLTSHKSETIKKTLNQIPEETASKINDIFYKIYLSEHKKNPDLDFDSLFYIFNNPMDNLKKLYNIQLIDDKWFLESEQNQDVKELVRRLQESSKEKKGTENFKKTAQAVHDALLLLWVKRKRSSNEKIWVLTQDTTLPSITDKSNPERPLAITLDALLQWISPITNNIDEAKVASIFSEAIRYQLLPQDNFFELKDFIVFSEMEWQCKVLPAQDVEECIRYVKANFPNMDPYNLQHLQRISREVVRFFADPGRKYKENIQNAEQRASALEKEIRDITLRKDVEIGELNEKLEYKDFQFKCFWGIIIGLFIFGVVIYMVLQFCDGRNSLQKILTGLPLLLLALGFAVFIALLIIGKKHFHRFPSPIDSYLNVIFGEKVIDNANNNRM